MGDERESYEVTLTSPNDGEKEGWKLVKKKCKASLCCNLDFLTLLRDILEKEPQPRLELQSKNFMCGQLFSTEFLDGMEILVN